MILIKAKEGQESRIKLTSTTDEGAADDVSADDEDAVELMVTYLYLHDYDAPRVKVSREEVNEGASTTPQSNTSAKPSALPLDPSGDCNALMHSKIYGLASKYAIDTLKDLALQKFSEAVMYAWNNENFVRAVEFVYGNTPDEDRGLRDIVTRAILQHKAVLVTKEAMRECIRSVDGLAYDLFMWEQAPP
jgi:hypothetical protein